MTLNWMFFVLFFLFFFHFFLWDSNIWWLILVNHVREATEKNDRMKCHEPSSFWAHKPMRIIINTSGNRRKSVKRKGRGALGSVGPGSHCVGRPSFGVAQRLRTPWKDVAWMAAYVSPKHVWFTDAYIAICAISTNAGPYYDRWLLNFASITIQMVLFLCGPQDTMYTFSKKLFEIWTRQITETLFHWISPSEMSLGPEKPTPFQGVVC